MTLLVIGAFLGAALTLAAQTVLQLYIVPKAEVRKRPEDRWERDVRELGELLTMQLPERAAEAQAKQGLFGDLKELETEPEQNPARIAQFRAEHSRETRAATRAFADLALTRVGWLGDRRATLPVDADELDRFMDAYRKYRTRAAIGRMWGEDEATARVDERWGAESAARADLLDAVKWLADMPHPPRTPLRVRFRRRGFHVARPAITRTAVRERIRSPRKARKAADLEEPQPDQ